MVVKTAIKTVWGKIDILDYCRRYKMRKQLKNRSISFLCPNCIGGILFHDLGLKFLSPTVNLMMFQTDFVKWVLNLDRYNTQKLNFFNHPEYSFPCAHLGDLTIHFTHYKTEMQAKEKWEERVERINKNNMFIFAEERDGLTYENILALGKLSVKGIVVFTAHDYPDIPYALYIPKYQKEGEVGNILKKSYVTGKHEYEKIFDFVKWFNEANGGNYDISNFVKKSRG